MKDYLTLYHPHRVKRTRLTEKAVRYVIRQRQKGESSSKIATELGITPRYVRMLWAKFQDTDRIPVPRKAGRPKGTITQDAVRTVLEWHGRMPTGVVRLTRLLKATNQEISYGTVYSIMKSENMITPSPAKSRRRKWVRYERKYSNAMWHVDWHQIKDPRLEVYGPHGGANTLHYNGRKRIGTLTVSPPHFFYRRRVLHFTHAY